MQYLPDWFREIAEFGEIMKTETEQFDSLSEAMQTVKDNFFIQSMDQETIWAWEKAIGIAANPAVESLEFRRARLINRISTRPPFTLQFLYEKLDELIGVGKWDLEIDYPNYTIYIEASASDQNWAGEILVTLNTVKPCHMAYISRSAVWSTLLMNEGIDLIKLTYNYRLNSWGLGLRPFADEQNQGVIVMPGQLSIQPELLDQTAAFVSQNVACARVNGNVLIETINKSTTENIVTIFYNITQEQAPTVTQVELLDADGEVLSSSGVYVPVLGTATFKHIFTLKEGT